MLRQMRTLAAAPLCRVAWVFLCAFTAPVLMAQQPAPETVRVSMRTFSERESDVPVQAMFAGPTHHVVEVLSSFGFTDSSVNLRPDSTYLLKLRYGPRGRFATYGKVAEIKVPAAGKGVHTTIQITRANITLKQERLTSDTEMIKDGKKFLVSISSSSQTVLDRTIPVEKSSADEYGIQRQWQSQEGTAILATFVSSNGSKVTLRASNGKVYEFDIARLSQADQQYVSGITAKR